MAVSRAAGLVAYGLKHQPRAEAEDGMAIPARIFAEFTRLDVVRAAEALDGVGESASGAVVQAEKNSRREF